MSQLSSSPSFYNDYLPQNATDDNINLHYSFNSKIMVAAIIILFVVIVFILMLHAYAKWFWYHSSGSIIVTRRGSIVRSAAVQPSVNTGLDATVIAQLPVFTYKASPSADGSHAEKHDSMEAPLLECAVCLSEFQENEQGRMLPSCKHTFHTECIDMWLFTHSTCPLCRTVISAAMVPDQHQGEGQEAMEASANAETIHVPSTHVQFPCNVLFWGNEAQVTSTQEPSSSNATPLLTSRARPPPQITIDIPPIGGSILVTISTPGRRSSRSPCSQNLEQAACSSQPLKSPGLQASLRRMLSRQSSRHAADQGDEGSPK